MPSFIAEPQSVSAGSFVAREWELGRLHLSLQTSAAGQGQAVYVTGKAGSGKTRLLNMFARQAQERVPALIPLWIACQSHSGPGNPYLPFRTMLARLVGEIEPLWRSGTITRSQAVRLWNLRHTASDLLREVAPDCLMAFVDPVLLPGAALPTAASLSLAREALFQQMTRFIQALSLHGPLLMIVDDLHWADVGSIDLLHFLRGEMSGYPVLLVGAYRPEEVGSRQSGSERHALARFLHEQLRHSGANEVSLDRADGRAFVNAWLDTEPNRLDETFRRKLFDHTQGHALFTVELVSDLQQRGGLRRDAQGYWHAGETVSWDRLPVRVEAIVAEWTDCLPPDLQHLVTAASTQGGTFVAEVVAQVVDRPLPEVISCLSGDLARGQRLVQPEGRQRIGAETVSTYRFRHSVFQRYVYGRLDPLERATLHRATGVALQRLYEAAGAEIMPIAAELAYHFDASQAIDQAITYHQLAGKQALRLSAHTEAIDHFRRSVALLQSCAADPERTRREIDSQLALGAARLAIEGYSAPAVKAAYDRAYALCSDTGATAEMVTSLFWLTSYYAVSGDLPQAEAVSRQMLSVVEQEAVDDFRQMQAHVLAGLPLFFLGRNDEALAHFQKANAIYNPVRHQPEAFTFGQDPGIASKVWEGHVRLHLGQLSAARSCLRQALTWSAELEHPYTRTFTHLLAGCTPYLGWYLQDLEAALVARDRGRAARPAGEFRPNDCL